MAIAEETGSRFARGAATSSTGPDRREFLEADGRGGFASGTLAGPRTRRYHALLLVAEADGTRYVLVNGAEVTVTTAAGSWALSTQAYAGGVVFPEGHQLLVRLPAIEDPWPRWIFALPDGTRIEHELFARHGRRETFLSWRRVAGTGPVSLRLRPLLSGRDYHALHHENPAFCFEPARAGDGLVFRPYDGVPGVALASNGVYRHDPCWYRRFFYAEEAARGLDNLEDLAAPGEITFDLARAGAALVLGCADQPGQGSAQERLAAARAAESERRFRLGSPLARAADAYLVDGAGGKTIIAGYPWFTDWGRDTFISLRGLAIATGRLADARAILLRWSEAISGGMLPNRFPDRGAAPEYNSVDAALWFVVAIWDYLEAANPPPAAPERARLTGAVESILAAHAAGTRHGIRADADGLLAAGEPGVQLTWMDAKIGDWVVTPRIGKPVEIAALWINALAIGAALDTPSAARWRAIEARARASFRWRFCNAETGWLNDVVDVDHRAGQVDAQLRPNQVFALGGLPFVVLAGAEARAIIDVLEAELLTPLGLRTLGPREPGYRPHFTGDMRARDSAYHQGTAWPWLLGPFVDAWIRVRGDTAAARAEARARFVAPLRDHLDRTGLGHLPEVADAAAPHAPGGCPFQAWSLAELIRLDRATALTAAQSR